MITLDNIRRYRRLLQGKGINIRETIVELDSYSVASVPGLFADDAIVSVLDLDDKVDVGAQIVRAAQATRVYGSGDARIRLTAVKAGEQGNSIYFAVVNDNVQEEDGVAQPGYISVENDATGNAVITWHLALASNGTVDTTDNSTSAPNCPTVVAAAIRTQADAPGHPRARDLVSISFSGIGSANDHMVAAAAAALQNGENDSQVGATAATLTDAEGLVWTARNPYDPRTISIVYDDSQDGDISADEYVTVVDNDDETVTITIVLGTDDAGVLSSTPKSVSEMVMDSYRQRTANAGDHGAAGAPFGAASFVSVAHSSSTTPCSAHSADPLVDGDTNGGFELATTPNNSAGNKVKVLWVSSHDAIA